MRPDPSVSDASRHVDDRRSFLQRSLTTGLAASAPYFVSTQALGGSQSLPASEKVTLGIVGIGPRCTYDLKSILPMSDVKCVAIADVQQSRRQAGKALVDEHYGNRDCQLYHDFRELLARDDIDAVLVATGDRWHAAASILAAQAGKDVYSEKPCGITIADCQAIDQTFSATGRIFQAGTQRRSVPNFVQAVQLAHSGRLGKLQELQATVYVPTLDNTWLPPQPTPAADQCDWNLWLGPAPWRPYNEKYVQGRWRGQYDFDSGARLLDWGFSLPRDASVGTLVEPGTPLDTAAPPLAAPPNARGAQPNVTADSSSSSSDFENELSRHMRAVVLIVGGLAVLALILLARRISRNNRGGHSRR